MVANGGILRGSGRGRLIDAHGYVFRLNGAVIEGFEEDVGSKTSFYGFTVNTMKNSLTNYRDLGFASVPQGRDVRYILIPSGICDQPFWVCLSPRVVTKGTSLRSTLDQMPMQVNSSSCIQTSSST